MGSGGRRWERGVYVVGEGKRKWVLVGEGG